MSESDQSSHWQFLANLLGAKPKEDSAAQQAKQQEAKQQEALGKATPPESIGGDPTKIASASPAAPAPETATKATSQPESVEPVATSQPAATSDSNPLSPPADISSPMTIAGKGSGKHAGHWSNVLRTIGIKPPPELEAESTHVAPPAKPAPATPTPTSPVLGQTPSEAIREADPARPVVESASIEPSASEPPRGETEDPLAAWPKSQPSKGRREREPRRRGRGRDRERTNDRDQAANERGGEHDRSGDRDRGGERTRDAERPAARDTERTPERERSSERNKASDRDRDRERDRGRDRGRDRDAARRPAATTPRIPDDDDLPDPLESVLDVFDEEVDFDLDVSDRPAATDERSEEAGSSEGRGGRRRRRGRRRRKDRGDEKTEVTESARIPSSDLFDEGEVELEEADEPTLAADSEADDEDRSSGDRRRRRRRRSRSSGRSESQAAQRPRELEEEENGTPDIFEAELDVEDAVPVPDLDDDQDELDQEDDAREARSRLNVPSWEDAISDIVARNTAGRQKGGGGGRRPRGRGGRRSGSR